MYACGSLIKFIFNKQVSLKLTCSFKNTCISNQTPLKFSHVTIVVNIQAYVVKV